MAEVIRQYGAACIAAVVAILLVSVTTALSASSSDSKGIPQIAGYAIESEAEIGMTPDPGLGSGVSKFTTRTAPKVSTKVAMAGKEYRVRELIISDTGIVSVISVENIIDWESVTSEVIRTKTESGQSVQYMCFPDIGRYVVRYRITDQRKGNEGATRNGTICIFVR